MVNLDNEILDRLLSRGAAALSEVELVAALLQKGDTEDSALDKARRLLEDCGGTQGLLTTDNETAGAHELDRVQSGALLAAVELSRRLSRIEVSADILSEPDAVARYLFLKYGRINQLVLGAIFVDVGNHPLGEIEAFRGIHELMTVEPGALLRPAIRHNSSGVFVFHIHPSGNPAPSDKDFEFAARMKKACELVGLELLDYLVLGGEKWTSVRRLKPW